MEIRNLDISNQAELSFVENLYLESFPPNERRDVDIMKKLYDSETPFFISVAIEEGRLVGFITHWELSNFVFVEHFSIAPEFRNGGYGRKAMELFIEKANRSILLEVEPPGTGLAGRRIRFYERLGFKHWTNVCYRQPPYTSGGESIPLQLMSWGYMEVEENFEKIKEEIYAFVY